MNEPLTAGSWWRSRNGPLTVRLVGVGFLRMGCGRAAKTPAVTYVSPHDDELTTRMTAEFRQMFRLIERDSGK